MADIDSSNGVSKVIAGITLYSLITFSKLTPLMNRAFVVYALTVLTSAFNVQFPHQAKAIPSSLLRSHFDNRRHRILHEHCNWWGTLVFRDVADIERLPKERAVQILKQLLFIDRPALLHEASKVPDLLHDIQKITQEKEFFFKNAQNIEELSAIIVQYHNEIELLEQEIERLKKSVLDHPLRKIS